MYIHTYTDVYIYIYIYTHDNDTNNYDNNDNNDQTYNKAIGYLEQKGVAGITGDCGFMMATIL